MSLRWVGSSNSYTFFFLVEKYFYNAKGARCVIMQRMCLFELLKIMLDEKMAILVDFASFGTVYLLLASDCHSSKILYIFVDFILMF